jgi:two-component system NtrC family sensor kinase
MSIVITNTDGNIEYVNPRFTAVTGYSADEVLGQNPRVLKSGLMDPQVYVSMWRTLSTGGEWRGELQNRKKNGELFWEYASISAIRNHRGVVTHYLAVKEDITARKILERQVSRSERMDGIAHALGSIAHSFNDLLNNVLGFASLIRKNAGDRDKTVRYLATIERSVHRGAELVQRLMAFSTSGGEMAEILDLRPLLEEAVRRVKERFPPRLLLHTNYEQDLPRLSGERGALIQCFANLLENACEAMQEAPSADPVLSIDARTLAHQGEGSTRAVAVSVCDTGSGISRELQDTIFEPFFTTKHDRDNRGLGLAVVHTIIRRHRGTISVQSDPGRGTTVTIFLPARAADSGEPASEDEARLRGERELILLVDDEPSMLSFGGEVLEEHNYRVLTARDGNEALELYRRHAADISLVVLDLLMPGMDGGQTYLEMKKINGNLRAFFCTGFTSDSVITSLLAEEHLRALRKPFRVDDFLATVRDVLRVA